MVDMIEYFRKRERFIRRAFDASSYAFNDDDDEDVVSEETSRLPKSSRLLHLIPYDRSINQLKRMTYRLAIEVRDTNRADKLIEYVKERDKDFEPYKRTDVHVTEWALRLAAVKPPLAKSRKRKTGPKFLKEATGNRYSEYLINPSQISKFSVELTLAYKLDIDWRNLTMFLAAIGGYDYIHGNRVPLDLASRKWVQGLMHRPNPDQRPK